LATAMNSGANLWSQMRALYRGQQATGFMAGLHAAN
jgi:hypothetical protein